MAEVATVPVRIKNLTDAEVLEAQLVENLMRRDVHPMEETQGLLVEITILHAATRQNTAQVLRDAATAYKVDTDAITLQVKQEFAAKEKGITAKRDAAKTATKAVKKAKAA